MTVRHKAQGFTLIELSIVLVVIGLIIGGVLVGQDLRKAAEVRAQITQIEKYNQAVNTFKIKYNALPGDMTAADVATFGFTAATVRLGYDVNGFTPARGNGDGILEGSYYNGGSPSGFAQGGETFWFWEDLSTNSGLIEGQFNTATDASTGTIGPTQLGLYIPQAKVGFGDYVMAVSMNGLNYFYVGFVTGSTNGVINNITSSLSARTSSRLVECVTIET